MVGFFSNNKLNSEAANGIFHHGGGYLFAYQIVTCLISVTWSFSGTFFIWCLLKVLGWHKIYEEGLDKKEHGELAYTFVCKDQDEEISLPMNSSAQFEQKVIGSI